MVLPALIIFLLGGGLLGLVLSDRAAKARRWRTELVALRVRFPRGLDDGEVAAWLSALGALRTPLVLEVLARAERIEHYLLTPGAEQADVLARTRVLVPGARVEESPTYLATRPALRAAAELRLTNVSRPLATERTAATSAALLSALSTLHAREVVRIQYLFTGLATPKPRPASDPARDLAQAERSKHREPLLGLAIRIGVSAPTAGRAAFLLRSHLGTLRLLDAPAVRLVRRMLPAPIVAARILRRSWPLTVWPVVANVAETAGLLALPYGAIGVPGLVVGRARQLPAGQVPSTGGSVLAESHYPGQTGRPFVIRPDDRLRHLYAIGPTGVGKSTLITNLAVADAAAGYGLFLIDPKGDLVENILERLPESAVDRVIVVDPSQTERPIGFNPLAVSRGTDELARELVADQVLHVFHDLYRAFWGPRTDDILRAALQTLVNVPAVDGTAFTLAEVSELLSNPGLRRYVTGRPELPQMLRDYWRSFDGLSEGERLQHIGPVNNKLRAFTMRTPLRLMLGQSQGLDLSAAIRQRSIVLVSLAKGRLGSETSQLIGSLLVSTFWQAVLGRVQVPADQRRPYYLYLDEFQDVVRQSEGLPDLLSQARGLSVGAVLANQYLDQLPESVRTAVLGTVRSQVAFQVEYDDARALERRFAPALSANDLMGLNAYELALRATVNGETVAPVTGVTRPLPEALREAEVLAVASRQVHGRDRAEVEAALDARLHRTKPEGFGRRRTEESA